MGLFKRGKRQQPSDEPMVRNSGAVPGNNGDAEKTDIPHVPESISEDDRAILLAMGGEIRAMRHRQGLLQRELTILSADIYRKDDELLAKANALAEKYNLKKGEREVNVRTGAIMVRKGK